MRTSIVLSGVRDPDLVALYKKVGPSVFSKMIKDALRMVTRGDYDRTKIPSNLVLQGSPREEAIKVNLIITAQKDDDIRELLSHILPGRISTFVKHTLRFYLGPVSILSGFLDDEYSKSLQAAPIPIQVFSIGSSEIRPKKRQQKPKTETKRKERKQSNTFKDSNTVRTCSQPMPSFEPVFVPQTVPYEKDIIETQIDTNNNEDDVLAMLESLLG